MGDELTCRPGMKLVSGPALKTDPDNRILPFCIDEHEVTNAEYYGYSVEGSESKFELVQKDCATNTWQVVDIRDTVDELRSSPANVRVDGENVCGIEIRKQPSATNRPKLEGKLDGPQKPVVNISWNEARAYCRTKGGDLAMGNQWEKAARGPNGNIFATKSGKLREDEACYDRDESCDVMSFAPNGYGLYDMTGNVWEWVIDGKWFKDLRGGSWNDGGPLPLRAIAVTVSDVYFDPPPRQSRSFDVGFRCVAAPQVSMSAEQTDNQSIEHANE